MIHLAGRRAIAKVGSFCALTVCLLASANCATAQICGAQAVTNNTSGPVSISAGTPTFVVPLAPYQFTLSTCARQWILTAQCTVQFKNTGSSTATVTPRNLGIDGLDVAPGSSKYILWSYALGNIPGGSFISGPYCAITSTQPGTSTGSVSVQALPQD